MKLTLERIQSALAPLAPSLEKIPILHIVGTNGKGSTAVFLESLARSHGLKTGLFTSPHFLTPRERLKINGEMLSEAHWLELANKTALVPNRENLTYFEWLTLLAAAAFIYHNVDVAIVEAGLGGSWDATCCLKSTVCILTPISLDHKQILGKTPAAIAKDKAGVLRGGIALSAEQLPEVQAVFSRRAVKTNTALFWANETFSITDKTLVYNDNELCLTMPLAELGLHGNFQAHNAGLALYAFSLFCKQKSLTISAAACQKGLRAAFHPGRFQFAGENPQFLLDGAHNQSGMETLVSELKRQKITPNAIIFSCMADKEIKELIKPLGEFSCPIFLPKILNNPRAVEPQLLADLFKELFLSSKKQNPPPLQITANIDKALKKIPKGTDIVLICGSLYLLADFYTLHPNFLLNPNRR